MKARIYRHEKIEAVLKAIRDRGGQIRMAEAIKTGITRYTLYDLLNQGVLERVSRGVYRLADLPPFSDPDLATIALRAPRAVICLISALSFHDITTAIPHHVDIAIAKGAEAPRIDHPPIAVYRFSASAFESGIEEHMIDSVSVRVYSPEKTIADCFKFRNRLGIDVVLEALKLYKSRKSFKPDELLRHADICRVANVMRPYLEVLV